MDQIAAIRVFARVVEAGSFTRAAASLQLTKPNVTKLVQQLERHLHVKLLQRTTRRVTVTPEGAAYYERTARLLAELDELEAELASAQGRPTGRLRVEIDGALANHVVIPQLAWFRSRYPGIALEVCLGGARADPGGAFDCAIRVEPAAAPGRPGTRRVALLACVTCATPGYLAGHAVPRVPADLLAGHQIIGHDPARAGTPAALRYARGGEAIEIEAAASLGFDDRGAQLTALRAGLGIAQTFGFLVRDELERGTLVELLAGFAPERAPVTVAVPAERHVSARLQVFVDWIAEVFAPYDAASLSASSVPSA